MSKLRICQFYCEVENLALANTAFLSEQIGPRVVSNPVEIQEYPRQTVHAYIRMINIACRIRATIDRLRGAAHHVDSSYSIVFNTGRLS